MHWKRALEYILKTNDLSYKEHARHFEILENETLQGPNKLKKQIDFDTREIEIKATFFEADYATMAQIGVDWTTISNGKVNLRLDNRSGSQVDGALFSAKLVSTKLFDVAAIINAFESKDKGKILANPQIRIMDGEEGKIKVGKNFYLTTRDFSGNTRYSEYEAGTILRVIPSIISLDGKMFIHLDINAEKSDVEVTSLGVTKKITEGKTKVLLLNGEETALAGMFSNQVTNVRKGIPLLKDLPWWIFGLRYFMGYNASNYSKKELIILIKAEIVPRLDDRNLKQISMQKQLEKRRRLYEQTKKRFSIN
jgi:type II secretory pathway component GspD/PulD (secretin)